MTEGPVTWNCWVLPAAGDTINRHGRPQVNGDRGPRTAGTQQFCHWNGTPVYHLICRVTFGLPSWDALSLRL